MQEEVLSPLLSPSFALFEDGRVDGREVVLANVRARKKRNASPRSLTWREQHVTISGATAVFLGEAVEHAPAEGERPASDLDGWNTLVWTWTGAKWEVTYWQWQQGGVQGEREMWNAEYRSGVAFTPRPNRLLASVAGRLKPGTALDVGMGQGRNAIHLASLGWTVTGIDISDVGLRIASETAARRKLVVQAINADMSAWDFGTERWDFVALLYIRPSDQDFHKIKASLKRGGTVVVEGFHEPRAQNWAPGQLAAIFSEGYDVVLDEVVDDVPDWGTHPDKLVRFVAQKL
jgi:SAM-dependent methyltransferase